MYIRYGTGIFFPESRDASFFCCKNKSKIEWEKSAQEISHLGSAKAHGASLKKSANPQL